MSSNKVSHVYSQPGSPRCPVVILDLYLSKLPHDPVAFYMQPMTKIPMNSHSPWFQRSPMGIHPLKNMMPNISLLSELCTCYTTQVERYA